MKFNPAVVTLYLCEGRIKYMECDHVYTGYGDFNLDVSDRRTILNNCRVFNTKDVIVLALHGPDDARIALYNVRDGKLREV